MPDAPDVMWGTDATMDYTTKDGWVWLFAAIDHYTVEAWTHLAARGGPLRRAAAGLRRRHRPVRWT